MTRFWIADIHANHPNIALYCNRPWLKPWMLTPENKWVSPEAAFECAEKMNEGLKRSINSRVKPEDKVVCVGDFACRGGEKGVQGLHISPSEFLSQLNGKWVIVAGNHDNQNSVKTDCDFMSVSIGTYEAGVQHRPLFDVEAYDRWLKKPHSEREATPWRMSQRMIEQQIRHTEYCRASFDFMIVGHVHEKWHVKKISGIWHINVGVDVNRYMPINDVEVINIFEKTVREANGGVK